MNSYELSRAWFDFAFDNPSRITPAHGILYLFCVEHCNRLGWKTEFGLPSQMAMEAIGIRNHKTYIKAFNDLVNWGFIELVEKSKNQYSANIIALVNFTKAPTKALTKAMHKHVLKQVESTALSIAHIDKPYNQEPYNQEPLNHLREKPIDFLKIGLAKDNAHMAIRAIHTKLDDSAYFKMLDAFYVEQIGCAKVWQNNNETQAHFVRWAKLQPAPALNGRDLNTIPTDKEILI